MQMHRRTLVVALALTLPLAACSKTETAKTYDVDEVSLAQISSDLAAGKTTAAAAVKVEPVNFEAELKPVLGQLPAYREAAKSLREGVEATLTAAPKMPSPERMTVIPV